MILFISADPLVVARRSGGRRGSTSPDVFLLEPRLTPTLASEGLEFAEETTSFAL